MPPSQIDTDSDHDIPDTILLHEAATILNLHAQAVTMQNVRSLILFILDIISDNYMRWREQFLMVLGKFFLERLVLDDRTTTSPDWMRMDNVVRS